MSCYFYVYAGSPIVTNLTLQHLTLSTAGSPTITSLTFDNQPRTLTCTSTGGPATNVTWRRDGVVITLNATHQQTKIVVDAVNGTYQTVLTIDPSVDWSDIVGIYNCIVENVRGKFSDTVVVPGETYIFYCSCYYVVYTVVSQKSAHPLGLAQFLVYGQSLLE